MEKENEQSLHVFVVGNDDSIFDFSSPLFKKVSSYAETIGRITVMCRTRKIFSSPPAPMLWRAGPPAGLAGPSVLRGPLTMYAVHAKNPLTFLTRTFLLGRRIMRSDDAGPRVITADNPFEEGLAAWLLARAFRLPLQLQIHTDVMSPFFRRASWKERIRYWLAKFLIPRADCVRAVSERIKDSLVRHSERGEESPLRSFTEFTLRFFTSFRMTTEGFMGAEKTKITVLPIWTDISNFLYAAPDSATEERFKNYDFKMVAVGRFVDKEKNFSMLIEIMRDFVRVCPGALLVLAGDGPDKVNYQSLVTNYNLENNVILERVAYDHLPSFLKAFDLFLLSSNYEGWGRAVVEAMASGIPVVMTDVGLAGEVVRNGENGIVVPVGKKGFFISALKEMAFNIEKRKRLGNAALTTVRAMSPKTREEYNLLYKKSFYPVRDGEQDGAGR